jgi:hypothetical protein
MAGNLNPNLEEIIFKSLKMIFKGANIGLGTWLIISDLTIFSSLWIRLNNLIVGALAVIIGAAMMNKRLWMGWVTVILGYWLVLSIFLPCITDSKICMWNTLIVGALLILGGLKIRAVRLFKSEDLYAYLKSRDKRIN